MPFSQLINTFYFSNSVFLMLPVQSNAIIHCTDYITINIIQF